MSFWDPLIADKEINARYRSHVDGILISRVRIMAIVGIIVHLSFNFLDWGIYPAHALLFLKLRLLGVFILFILFFFSFVEKAKAIAIWLVDIAVLAVSGSIVYMIFLTDGSSSRYYEGINVVFIGMAVINSFYTKSNVVVFLIMFAMYELAVFTNGGAFNRLNFYFANFFMISVGLFISLMTQFYSIQHKRAFLRQEQLKLSEEKLLEDISKRKRVEEDLRKAYSDLKHVQAQLLQSEKMASVGQLAAGVAHEINNPLGFISNNMEIFQGYVDDYTKIMRVIEQLKAQIDKGDFGKAKETMAELKKVEEEVNLDYMMSDISVLLGHSVRGIERIRRIVLDLRTFSKEDKTENMELVKVEEIIESILNIVQSEIKYKAELIKEYGDTPAIIGSSQRLGQVFINLFINAVQAIKTKGTITVKTYRQGEYVCVDIIDTGQGIPKENLEKVFDPFFTTKPLGQGTGLGLSVSYEIIEKHRGKIEVKSRIGEGATFTVFLPVGVCLQ